MPSEWPADWEELKRGKSCPMCASGRPAETEYGIRVREAPHSDAYLQKKGKVRGYCVVIWRGRHVAEPMELSADESAGYWHDVLAVAKALEDEYRPYKINIEMLGNTTPHLHTHVRPRHRKDPNPFGPLPHDGDYTTFPEDQLRADAAALQARLAQQQ